MSGDGARYTPGPLLPPMGQGPTEGALRQERDFVSAVIDTAAALVVVLDPLGKIVRFNQASERTTGYSFEEVRGKTLWDVFLVTEEVEAVRDVFEQLRAGQFPNEFENLWLTKAGGRRLIAWSNTAILGAGGEVEYVIGTGIDITERREAERQRDATLEMLRHARHELEVRVAERTAELQIANRVLEEEIEERKRVERALRQSEGHMRSLMESAESYAVYRLAVDPVSPYLARPILASSSMAKLLNISDLDDLASWFANIHPDDLQHVVQAHRRSLETGVSFDQQFRTFRAETGEWKWAHVRSTPVFDSLGLLTHFNGLVVDITEQKRAEQRLEAMVAFEDAIARISGSFINLAPDEVDDGIRHALQAIGTAYHVERTYVFQFSGDRSGVACTHEWCAAGIEPQIHRLRDLPAGHLRWTLEQIQRSEVVQIRDGSDLPEEAKDERAEFQALGLRSRIVVPMVCRGTPVGFVGFDSTRPRQWTKQSMKLQVIGDILVNALEHRRSQEIQAGQHRFLELLATGGDFSGTLHTLVRLIEDQWPGMLGLILLLDEDRRHLHVGASVGLPQEYVRSIEGLEIGPMVGSCGTACYRGERVIVEDTATDPRWEGLRDLALRYGLRACWSEPVFSPYGQVVGTFAMYYRQLRGPTEAELQAIELGAHLVGVAVEHKRAEQALRESEAKFRGIVEYANIGIAIVQEARFRFVNPHFASMLGYTLEEMLGNEFMGYCTPNERDRILDIYARRARGESGPLCYETALLHRNGGHVYAEVSAGIIPYGGHQATFVFLRDITEEKQAKEALEDAYLTMEQRVEERTRELAVLNSIAAVVSGSLDLTEIMHAALDKTREALNMAFGTAYGLVRRPEQEPAISPAELDPQSQRGQEAVERIAQALQGKEASSAEASQLHLLAHRGVSAEYAGFVGELRLPGAAAALALAGRPFVWLVEDTVPPDSDLMRLLNQEGCRQVVTLPLMAKGKLVGAINLGTHTPRTFAPEQLSLLSAIGQQIGVAMENARLYEAEQGRREEAERRRHVAEGMREILAVLNSRQSLPDILDFIATQTCRLLDSNAAAILRLDDGVLRIQAACGLDADYARGMAMPLGQGNAGRALALHRPEIVDLTVVAQRVPPEGMPAEPQKSLLGRLVQEFRAILSVPLVVQGQDYGAITAYYRDTREFSEEDLRLATGVADQAALAVESARLREQAEQAAAMEERSRLARALHDSVTQCLYSVTMYTEAAARLMPPGHEASEYLREARDTAQEALREMRLMIYQLRPPILEKGGLAVALQVRLDAVERRGGIHAELMVEGEERLPPTIQVELYQIAQEALNNALKHAHARQVRVLLHFGQAATQLKVQDDGVGFDLALARAGGGLGLPGLAERAQKIGARLEIDSAPGCGTQVCVAVPTGGGE
jgi:PAS domain S-box-containing protein